MRILITADDTTGALESAAACADAGWPSQVVPWSACIGTPAAADALVVDLRSRHVAPEVAVARLAAVLRHATPVVHKIDSTLRGNWPAEIGALVEAGHRVVLLVAYPAAGRVCVGGIVREHGIAVDATTHACDPRSPVRTARPSTLLPASIELDGAAALAAWLRYERRPGVAVVDAGDDAALVAAVDVAMRSVIRGVMRDANRDVVLVGTAAVVGAFAEAMSSRLHDPIAVVDSGLAAPVLVVCGSAHPVSRTQVAALVRWGALRLANGDDAPNSPPAVSVLDLPAEQADDPGTIVDVLGAVARRLLDRWPVRSLVLVGGDTAHAVLGDAEVTVVGSLGVGVASGFVHLSGRTVQVVSKPGAFGDAGTLVSLVASVPASQVTGVADDWCCR